MTALQGSDIQQQALRHLKIMEPQPPDDTAAKQWLCEAQRCVTHVSSTLKRIETKLAEISVPIPHTEFDDAIGCIRPMHQMFQLISDLPRAALVGQDILPASCTGCWTPILQETALNG